LRRSPASTEVTPSQLNIAITLIVRAI